MNGRDTKSDSPANQTKQRFWGIGIGASAGGLEALTMLISNLPADFFHPIIIAQHLAPHAKSMMVELLQRHTKFQVVAAADKQKLIGQHIYVVPPNHDIDIVDDHILLTVAGVETRPKPSIDEFFESLARAFGARSIGIVLSGTGSDGSEGIKAIKAVGGYTFAQDDKSAKYDGMPRSAVNTGDVDSVLSPEEIAKALQQTMNEHEARIQYNTLDHANFGKIFALLKEVHGTDFSQYKSSTIGRRIARHMNSLGVKSPEPYYEMLKSSPAELSRLAQEMLVSVTSFFRDPEVFEAVTPLIHRLVGEKKQGEEIRVWVAGCASGEEAYTLAMLFAESADRQRKHVIIKVFATDLDQDALLEGRNGTYSDAACSHLPTDLLQKYFIRRNDGYEASKRLREIVVFARQDLTQHPPFVKLDFISCRNVLIYFDSELQKKVIEIFHYALNPSGILLLGKSESLTNLSTLFETFDRVRKVFQKINIPSKVLPSARLTQITPMAPNARTRTLAAPSVTELSYLKLLNAYGICGATVDQDCNIIQIIGDVSPYLGFFTPQPDFRLTNLLPKGVGVEIPLLIRKAKKDGQEHRSRSYPLSKGPKGSRFFIKVRCLSDEEVTPPEGQQLFVINFEMSKKRTDVESASIAEVEIPARVMELEQELFVTREHLQTVVEELGVSNEELQSLNEELSSTNEELQASSEELETTNEELQSSNEELTTVNEELNSKQAELRALNISFENVQNSMGSPMVILDNRNCILRFNPESLKIFNLTGSDIGRNITRISSNFEILDFKERLEQTLKTGQESESLVAVGQTRYQLRILPCLDENKAITGTILIFIDNTALLRTQDRLMQSEERLRAIINGSANLIFLKDTLGRYLLINDAFKKFFQVDEKQILGKTDREIFSEMLAISMRDADLDVLVKRTVTRKQESWMSPNGQKSWFVASRFPLMDPTGQAPYAIGTVAMDITAQIDAQNQLAQSESRYRAVVEDQAVFVCRHTPDGKLTFVNAAFSKQFGIETGLELKPTFQKIVPESDRAMVEKEIATISFGNPIIQYEHKALTLAGQQRWIRWIHRGLFDSSGQIQEYQAVGFDVTETRRKTDHLMERDTIFSNVFDQTSDFMSIIRLERNDFILESFNRSAAKTLGSTSWYLTGSSLREILDPIAAPAILQRYRSCVDQQKPQVFEETMELPGGVRYLLTTLVPIFGKDGHVERIASISRDISSYKRAETDLRKAKDDAEAANQSKSDFLASMSHELRTPLNVVLGMSQLLMDTGLSEEQKNYISTIHRSGHVLLTLIEDVLDVSKIEAGTIKLEAVAFNPTDVVRDVVDLFLLRAKEKSIRLVANISPDADRMVVGDPARLRQILVNLIGNAVKFTDKGQVTIDVAAQIDRQSNENVLRFCVQDTGIGIDSAKHDRLFKRFSQIDTGSSRKYGGTGLGLVISKQLVNMMRGSLNFESEKDQGSKFWFTVHLPLSTSAPISTSSVAASADMGSHHSTSLKILAVDDNPDNCRLIGLFLKKLGHQVVVAHDGLQALETVKTENVDLIFMDIQMPEMDGYEATRHIRQMPQPKATIPVIALTANAMSGDSERAFAAGMDDYLTKPIDLRSLKNLLSKWTRKIETHEEHK